MAELVSQTKPAGRPVSRERKHFCDFLSAVWSELPYYIDKEDPSNTNFPYEINSDGKKWGLYNLFDEISVRISSFLCGGLDHLTMRAAESNDEATILLISSAGYKIRIARI